MRRASQDPLEVASLEDDVEPETVLLVPVEELELESVPLESLLLESVLDVSVLVLDESVLLDSVFDELDESVLEVSELAESEDVVVVAATTGITIAAPPMLPTATSTVAIRVRSQPLRLPSIVVPLDALSVRGPTLGGLAGGGPDALHPL